MRTEKLIEKWCDLWNTVGSQKTWVEKNNWRLTIDKLEYLITLSYFLSLRRKIKKEVQENYNNLDYQYNFISYDEYGFFELDCVNLEKRVLQPLIDKYIKKVVVEIESNSLKLEL
jgi:hypothetical protein